MPSFAVRVHFVNNNLAAAFSVTYRDADKSLAPPGKKQAASVKRVMCRGMDCFGLDRDRCGLL